MFIILGGTGHVGSAAARALLSRGQKVTIVTRDPARAAAWEKEGAGAAVGDVLDVDGLRRILRTGRRAFLLNPPADPSADTDAQEKKTAAAIAVALEGSGLEKVVAESTYGAQPTERAGDLNVLYGFERALGAQDIPASVIRAAYYFSNWDASLETARDEGVVHSMFPADFKLPMVAPQDLGAMAADLLMAPPTREEMRYVEGPERYSPGDVAQAFAEALDRPVTVAVTPRGQIAAAFRKMGFSEPAADSYARMTEITLDDDFSTPMAPSRGETTLQEYIRGLVAR